MKSGDFNVDGDWTLLDADFVEIRDLQFEHKTFRSKPSLRRRESRDGWIQETEYNGQPYDEAEFELIANQWDHQHCSLCFATIKDGLTYWANKDEVTILCDRCFSHYEDRIHAQKERESKPS